LDPITGNESSQSLILPTQPRWLPFEFCAMPPDRVVFTLDIIASASQVAVDR